MMLIEELAAFAVLPRGCRLVFSQMHWPGFSLPVPKARNMTSKAKPPQVQVTTHGSDLIFP